MKKQDIVDEVFGLLLTLGNSEYVLENWDEEVGKVEVLSALSGRQLDWGGLSQEFLFEVHYNTLKFRLLPLKSLIDCLGRVRKSSTKKQLREILQEALTRSKNLLEFFAQDYAKSFSFEPRIEPPLSYSLELHRTCLRHNVDRLASVNRKLQLMLWRITCHH